MSNEKIAMRVSINTIIWNVILTVFKAFAGILGHSTAMLADAAHSLSDILSTVVVMVGVKLAGKKADHDHKYGHERFECVAAIILSVMLLATGVFIGIAGIEQLTASNTEESFSPGLFALIGAIISIAAKEGMYWYTRAAAKKINSGALMADAWHHRSDALSSVGSFVGILGALLFGLNFLDSIAAIVICLFVAKVAFDIFRDAVGKMTDRACDEETVQKMRDVILAQEKVLGIDLLKTRLFGDRIYAEVEILVDGDSTLKDAHETAHVVHDAIEHEFVKIKHCTVHVNPS
ncbi:MAG: cation diffusion facilitator family transporter [Oscillospiraceae bacterium]|nr:cation diffusion facilitator family transporter [Oscillospiraceae bacterium]